MSIRQRKQQQQQSGQAQQADDDQALQKPATNRSSGSWSLQPLGLLCTGTTLMVLGQYINMQAAIDPNAQLLVLMRYVFAFALSAVNCARESQAAHQHRNVSSTSTSTSTSKAAQDVSQQQPQCAVSRPAVPTKVKLLLLLMGMLDLASYAIFNIGYAAAGSALAAVVLAATGQICTAVLSVALLHRQLSCKHLAAVTIVTLGLVLRSADDLDLNSVVSMFSGAKAGSSSDSSSNSTSAANGMDGKALLGVGCVALSALLFSVLGCMYEVLMAADQAHSVTQAQASAAVTRVSLVATLAHQLYYTLPNLGPAVLQPVAASSHSAASIAASHLLYGVITAAHQMLQVKLLSSQGAMAVGLVNAVRASVVSFVSSWFFCSSVAHLCLSYWRAVGAMVVTAGAALWVVAGKPIVRQPLQTKSHVQ